MGLRIPGIQIQNITPAVGFRLIRRWILLRERSKRADPATLEMQAESVIEGVAGLVPQNSHALNVGAAFNLSHEFSLELHQPRMRQVKRDRKTGNAVRSEPLR